MTLQTSVPLFSPIIRYRVLQVISNNCYSNKIQVFSKERFLKKRLNKL
jgi:hypothetical protein